MSNEDMQERLASLKAELANVQGTPTEVYSRIVGYYRSVRNWNAGKRDEYGKRRQYRMPGDLSFRGIPMDAMDRHEGVQAYGRPYSYLLFTRETCPNCPPVHAYLTGSSLKGALVDVDTPEGLELAMAHGVMASPTAILRDESGSEVYRAYTVTELKACLTQSAAV